MTAPKWQSTRFLSANGPGIDTRDWATTMLEPAAATVTEFSIQHGTHMAPLQVRICRDPHNHLECDAAIAWLREPPYPSSSSSAAERRDIVGLHTESGGGGGVDGRDASLQVIEIASATRCVLFLLRATSIQPIALSPALAALLRDKTIGKTGAELWADAIDIWSFTRGQVATDACIDLTFCDDPAVAKKTRKKPSVAQLLESDVFSKDEETACSNWATPLLTWRQLVYAALEAQASYYAADATSSMVPFHLSESSIAILSQVATWKTELRLQETLIESQAHVNVDVAQIEPAGNDCIVVYMNRFSTRIRPASQVWVHMCTHDAFGPLVRSATHIKVDGQRARITGAGLGLSVRNIDRVTLSRADEETYTSEQRAATRMIGRMLRGSLLRSPILRALWAPRQQQQQQQTPRQIMPATPAHDLINTGEGSRLDASQLQALALADACHITLCSGSAGTGKSKTIATRTRALLARGERMWCVAETNMAVRNMALAISKMVDDAGKRMTVCVSKEFYHEWHTADYAPLMALGCVHLEKHTAPHREVMVTTISTALAVLEKHPQLAREFVTNLVFDESSQVSALSGATMLEVCSDARRVLLVGDDAQLPPYSGSHGAVGREPVRSILDFFAKAEEALAPHDIQIGRCMLQIQYRMPIRLGRAISSIFYNNTVVYSGSSGDQHPHPAQMLWMETWPDSCVTHVGTSLMNQREAHMIQAVCEQFISNVAGCQPRDLVVLSFYDAQTALLIKLLHPMGVRACNVDSFQGQEAKIVLVSLVADRRPSAFLTDPRRINVACSRAQQQLLLFGRRTVFQHPSAGAWYDVLQCCHEQPSM